MGDLTKHPRPLRLGLCVSNLVSRSALHHDTKLRIPVQSWTLFSTKHKEQADQWKHLGPATAETYRSHCTEKDTEVSVSQDLLEPVLKARLNGHRWALGSRGDGNVDILKIQMPDSKWLKIEPDVVLNHDSNVQRFTLELKFPNKPHNLSALSSRADTGMNRLLGQAVQQAQSCGTRFCVVSTYNETIFLHLRSVNKDWTLEQSPVFPLEHVIPALMTFIDIVEHDWEPVPLEFISEPLACMEVDPEGEGKKRESLQLSNKGTLSPLDSLRRRCKRTRVSTQTLKRV